MSTTIVKHIVQLDGLYSQGLYFIPQTEEKIKPFLAACTHGHTSHKGSILTWAIRLSDYGIPTVLFDLPGHYLGSFNEVENFDLFEQKSHWLFYQHLEKLKNFLNPEFKAEKIIFAGHSLGGLLALKSHRDPRFKASTAEHHLIGVGLGMAPQNKEHNHILETAFFKKTLDLYQQFVTPTLRAPKMFEWIKHEKEQLDVTGQKIYLLTGIDDVVATPEQTTLLAENLRKLGNEVTLDIADSLSHHTPEKAPGHIMGYLKKAFKFL